MRQRFYISDADIAAAKVKRKHVITQVIKASHPESTMYISCIDCHFDNVELEMSWGLVLWDRAYMQANIYPHRPHPPIIIELNTDKQLLCIVECPEYFYRYVEYQRALGTYAAWVDQGKTAEDYWAAEAQFTAMNPHRI